MKMDKEDACLGVEQGTKKQYKAHGHLNNCSSLLGERSRPSGDRRTSHKHQISSFLLTH